MSKKIIKTKNAPAPVGPYNQAVSTGSLVFTAGQICINPATGELELGTIEAQTKLVLSNLKAVLEAAGSSMEKVIKTTVYLKDMNDFPKMNTVYAGFFVEENAPARSAVEVARLPKDVLVEVEAIALVG